MTKTWFKTYWPHIFGSAVALTVGLPAAIASYRHGMTVIERSSDPGMAGVLPMTTDGLLIASLVALWVRRMTRRTTGVWHWGAFGLGLAATTLTNLAGARTYIDKALGFWDIVEAVGWAIWPPICLAIVLEIVAWMVVPDQGQTRPVQESDPVQTPAGPPVDQQERSDEDLLVELREIIEKEGKVPSRESVRTTLGVGSKRADRLRTLVQTPVRLVPTESDSDDEETGRHREAAR